MGFPNVRGARPRAVARAVILLLLVALAANVAYPMYYGPSYDDMEDLDLTDPINAAVVAIGSRLASLAHVPPDPACPWCYPRIEGMLFVVRPGGVVRPVRYYHIEWYRYRKAPTYLLLEAARNLEAGTILHLGFEDHDVYFHEASQGPNSTIAKAIRQLTNDHPNLFWVHWNPSVVDPVKGWIGPRSVPIPHYEAFSRTFKEVVTLSGGPEGIVPKPWAQRKPTVAWRGVTTGFFNDYTTSDRYVTAELFHQLAPGGSASVGFTRITQPGVVIPPRLRMAGMSKSALLESRVLLDVDGHANAWEGLRWKLLAGAAVVKVDPHRFIQWYYPQLRHGTHLWVVPRGDARIVNESLFLASSGVGETIAAQGRAFALQTLTMSKVTEAMLEIIRHVDRYRTPRDWTIAGSRR